MDNLTFRTSPSKTGPSTPRTRTSDRDCNFERPYGRDGAPSIVAKRAGAVVDGEHCKRKDPDRARELICMSGRLVRRAMVTCPRQPKNTLPSCRIVGPPNLGDFAE